jgi:Protein of unknown function (DUF3667)
MKRKSAFCGHCGQRDTDGKMRMIDIMRRFWNTTLHLDGKFWRMVWHLLIPGKVAKNYFLGRQKRYPHPIQFFLVVMFFLLIYISRTAKENTSMGLVKLATGSNTVEQLQGKVDLLEDLRQNYDSLAPELRSEQAKKCLDSLLTYTKQKEGISIGSTDSIHLDILHFLPGIRKPIALTDALLLSPDSLNRYYGITHPVSKHFIQQFIKTSKDGKGLFKFYIGSAAWTFLVITALMAIFLRILFRSKPRLYVEHFLGLLLHITGFLFLLTLLSVLKRYLSLDFISKNLSLWWLGLGGIYWFKNFYYGSWLRVTLKFCVFGMAYFIIGIVIFMLSFGVCLLLY